MPNQGRNPLLAADPDEPSRARCRNEDGQAADLVDGPAKAEPRVDADADSAAARFSVGGHKTSRSRA